MKRQVVEVDIEVFPNMFFVGVKDFETKDVFSFEISAVKDEKVELYKWLSNYSDYWIDFNGLHYDQVVLKYFLKEYSRFKKLNVSRINTLLKKFSDAVIDGDREKINEYKYNKIPWIPIDLMCYWSKMTRISKKISLKSLGIQLEYPVVMELPFSPSQELTEEQMQQIRVYNLEHDLGILDLLAVRMKDDIKLRHTIRKETGLECLSMDAPKIASEALLSDYCKITGHDINETRNLKFFKPTLRIGELLEDFEPDFKLKVFKDLYLEICNSVNSFNKEFNVLESNTNIILSFGIGGLHSINSNEMYYSTETHQIMTSDGELIKWLTLNFFKLTGIP